MLHPARYKSYPSPLCPRQSCRSCLRRIQRLRLSGNIYVVGLLLLWVVRLRGSWFCVCCLWFEVHTCSLQVCTCRTPGSERYHTVWSEPARNVFRCSMPAWRHACMQAKGLPMRRLTLHFMSAPKRRQEHKVNLCNSVESNEQRKNCKDSNKEGRHNTRTSSNTHRGGNISFIFPVCDRCC